MDGRIKKMTNEEIIRRFEADLVPEDSFHHADHVHLAFGYLSQYPPLEALERFCTALKRFATARGKPGRYHETITHAYFFLIRERMVRCAAADWDDFARANSDLLAWKNGILTRYYQESTLQSELARSVFLFPDKCG
jgi:DNA-binding Lrp family transcriptional regulator